MACAVDASVLEGQFALEKRVLNGGSSSNTKTKSFQKGRKNLKIFKRIRKIASRWEKFQVHHKYQ
jgi:hypothetical protein